jgi:hypothetical protein
MAAHDEDGAGHHPRDWNESAWNVIACVLTALAALNDSATGGPLPREEPSLRDLVTIRAPGTNRLDTSSTSGVIIAVCADGLAKVASAEDKDAEHVQ